jgi:hypothetical protein
MVTGLDRSFPLKTLTHHAKPFRIPVVMTLCPIKFSVLAGVKTHAGILLPKTSGINLARLIETLIASIVIIKPRLGQARTCHFLLCG